MSTAPSIAIDVPARASRYYRPELDVLRFLAAFAVYVFHSFPKDSAFWVSRGFPQAVSVAISGVIGAGRFGVDLFFALSAFLITELLFREREERGFVDVKAFYIRRVLRIWPLYFFFIAIACGITLWDKAQHVSWAYAIAFMLLAGNWIVALHGAPLSVIVPLWSVSVEEQFYLVWPWAVRKVSPRGIAVISVLMLLCANLTRIVLVRSGHSGDSIWCNSLARLDAMALGILFALAVRRFEEMKIPRKMCFFGGLILWILASHFFTKAIFAYPAAALGSLLFLSSAYQGPLGRFKHLIYLGKISYGIYVFHELGLLLSHHLLGAYTKSAKGYAAYWAVAFALTIVFAMVSYRVIEKPFLEMKRRFTFVQSRPV